MQVAVLEDEISIADRLVGILDGWERASEVVSFASNKELSLHLHAGNTIDILLADLKLPDGSGCNSIRLLSTLQPESLSLAISALSDGASISKAIASGAIGYMHKEDTSQGVISMLEEALKGMSPMSPSVAKVLFEMIRQNAEEETPCAVETPKSANDLTPRQIEVLLTISKGFSYNEVAKMLGLSINTVPAHVRNIYKKLHANNKLEAVYEARRLGIIE